MHVEEDTVRFWEMWGALTTAVGFPFAILVFLYEHRKTHREKLEQEKKERENEEEETYIRLNARYSKVMEILINNPAINVHDQKLEDVLKKQQYEFYATLIALFEESYNVIYPEDSQGYAKMWNTWEDFIKEWLLKRNFVISLPLLLDGEDPDFVRYMKTAAAELVRDIPRYIKDLEEDYALLEKREEQEHNSSLEEMKEDNKARGKQYESAKALIAQILPVLVRNEKPEFIREIENISGLSLMKYLQSLDPQASIA
ncbi:MAG: hypothetical protein L6Q57_05345 [Alphaproteobacteria bacterium]|nr:hypothetical protein [Alphaproteobacteria bacterium]